MTARDLLDELTIRYHMRMDYEDIWGEMHQVDPLTRRRLLAAMGVPTESDLALQVHTAEQDSRRLTRVLPRVQVVSGDARPRVVLTLPVGCEGRPFSWALLEESEELHDGELMPGELEPLGELEVDEQRYVRLGFTLPVTPPWGYHRFAVEPLDGSPLLTSGMALIVTPERCYQPPAVRDRRRVWGPAVQLYSLRSQRNWGVGDFTDLRAMIDTASQLGASVVGLNPLHALFPHNPWHCSPYSPSSRLFLNMVYLDLEAIEEFPGSVTAAEAMESDEFRQRLAACREREVIDYGDIGSLKRWILELLYRDFRDQHLDDEPSERGQAFRDWVEDGGSQLARHTLYEALQEHFHGKDNAVWGWQLWPEAYQDPQGPEVAAFAEEQAERVEFFQWVQWEADRQLGQAAERARELELGIGLYADLAVSVDRAGAEVWGNQSVFAATAAAGAPPDALAPQGQNWGLPPLNPAALTDAEYAPFAAILAANMRHAGALRIDHVMGLLRLYWVPQGRPASEGAYVHYPFDDLIRIVALESHRNRCLVIGEDLGTVPEEVREKLHNWGVLSYRLLLFEREADGSFMPPESYPRQALVAASTHDLPTINGFWAGRDISWRKDLGLFPDAERERAERVSRDRDRQRLLDALDGAKLLPSGKRYQAETTPQLTPELLVAVQAYLARSPAQVLVLQWEDLLGQIEQANLPGTTDEHPNWRRRLPVNLDQLPKLALIDDLVAELRKGPGERRGLLTGTPEVLDPEGSTAANRR
jgi:(1->4)-alpha-D-glucan 1-alpha-D-glucosylmutase